MAPVKHVAARVDYVGAVKSEQCAPGNRIVLGVYLYETF